VLRLIASGGREVRAAIEMMSGAAWVAETLEAAGWRVQVADSRKARALAPLAAKTDKPTWAAAPPRGDEMLGVTRRARSPCR
jgi:hypothetical protein